jgi:acyl-CoA reductase-like NAD-dependent aldehyde dehydrogenase
VGEAEIETALKAAERRTQTFAAVPIAKRAQALRALAAGLRRRADAIVEAAIVENGCPRKQALVMQALV